MDLQEQVKKVMKTAVFEGVTITAKATADSRLVGTVSLNGSIDLPGDTDAFVAGIFNAFKGNSETSSDSQASF